MHIGVDNSRRVGTHWGKVAAQHMALTQNLLLGTYPHQKKELDCCSNAFACKNLGLTQTSRFLNKETNLARFPRPLALLKGQKVFM